MTFYCRNILLIIFFSFLLNGTLKSQVSGYVFDITDNTPIENVNIVVKGTNAGTSTNAKGYFRLNIDNNKAVLIFSHLSFQTDTISLLNATFSKPATIFLMPKMTHLQEAMITSKKIKKDLFWVSDYIFVKKNILVLGNDLYKNVYKLILLRNLNDTITSLYLPSSFKPRGLFIDCMGLGYALSEELPMKDGYLVSDKIKDLQIIKPKDMPEIVVLGVEVEDPVGPYGAKGLGEIGLVPTAAAVANAFCDFDGKRLYSLPLKRK